MIGKSTLFSFGHRSGLFWMASSLRDDRVTVLMYHGVRADDETPSLLGDLHVPRRHFDEQMAYLARSYRPMHLPEVVERLERRKALPRRAVCVTFDDGYRNNYTEAFPVLKAHGVPASLFLTTGLIGTDGMLWHDRVERAVRSAQGPVWQGDGISWDVGSRQARKQTLLRLLKQLKELPEDEKWVRLERLERSAGIEPGSPATEPDSRLLSWDEVREMHESGLVTMGAHTVNHPILSRLPRERAKEEMRRSRETIEAQIGGRCDLLCYPNGGPADFSPTVLEDARALGFRAGISTLTGSVGPGDDLFVMRRIGISGSDGGLADFSAAVSGIRSGIARARGRAA